MRQESLKNHKVVVYFMVQESIKHFPIPLLKSLRAIAEGDFLDYKENWF